MPVYLAPASVPPRFQVLIGLTSLSPAAPQRSSHNVPSRRTAEIQNVEHAPLPASPPLTSSSPPLPYHNNLSLTPKMAEKVGANEVRYIDNVTPPQELADTKLDRFVTGRSDIPDSIASLSPEERRVAEKKLVRRIDFRLLPMLVMMYIMNYLDRNNIAAARLTGKKGLQKDLNMTDTQYQVS